MQSNGDHVHIQGSLSLSGPTGYVFFMYLLKNLNISDKLLVAGGNSVPITYMYNVILTLSPAAMIGVWLHTNSSGMGGESCEGTFSLLLAACSGHSH